MAEGIADFTEFYRRHAPDVFRFALYLTGERSDAEDITSETFVRVWTSTTPIDETTVRAYLFTIARHLHLRSAARRARDRDADQNAEDTAPDPYARTAARDDMRVVRERLFQLGPIDRAALLLRAIDEMPYEQIARTLNISVASAKVKVHRARLALADLRS